MSVERSSDVIGWHTTVGGAKDPCSVSCGVGVCDVLGG